MERSEKTNAILRQFRKKSKRVVNKDLYTEFFYLNKNRSAIEFLAVDDELMLDGFLKRFLPQEFRDFVSLKLMDDSEEEIRVWFYDNENLVIVIEVNWGFKKQEISIDLDIENFSITVVDDEDVATKEIDYVLFNEFLISFLTTQAENLAQSFEKIVKK